MCEHLIAREKRVEVLWFSGLTYPYRAPVKIGPQERCHICGLQAVQFSIRNIVNEDGSDGSCIRDEETLLRLMSAVVTRSYWCGEYVITAGDCGGGRVLFGISREVADEVKDGKGAIECSSAKS